MRGREAAIMNGAVALGISTDHAVFHLTAGSFGDSEITDGAEGTVGSVPYTDSTQIHPYPSD